MQLHRAQISAAFGRSTLLAVVLCALHATPEQVNQKALLPGQVPLDRIEAPLDDLPDNVRCYEVNSACPL